ncbi:hypothetical protein [Streptomyces sp. AK02-04a]|uniref:hypothetical protein n=1 Tax=Streptomyces sp. AK02-04a TaxID=3028649 RepID=UPI0029BA1802|nr:hypothetical protein [Streptomyces sp. AK02-04a]MDX3763111.1 hypothetical protein [Streptomyces sp. AK02-04a]
MSPPLVFPEPATFWGFTGYDECDFCRRALWKSVIQVAILIRASARVTVLVDVFGLEDAVERFADGVVEARSDAAAPGREDAQAAAGPPEPEGAVLAPPVTGKDDAVQVAATGGRGHVERDDDQAGVVTGAHRTAGQTAGETADDRDRQRLRFLPPTA